MIMQNFSLSLLAAAGTIFLAASTNAVVIDLSTAGSSGSINGALFFESDQQPSGTGFIDPFLRVQAHGNSTFEHGYNTDGGFPLDTKPPHNYQHSVRLDSLAAFNIGGVSYFKFMLDANQSGGGAGRFGLDRLQFYTSNDPAQTTVVINPNQTLNLGNLAYNLDLQGDNSIITHSTGSGKYDLIAFIPTANFNQADSFLYLYFASGDTIAASGGFEEWTASVNVTPIPELSSFFPIIGLMVAVGSTHVLRRRRMARTVA